MKSIKRKGLFLSTTFLVATTSLSKLIQQRLDQKQEERTEEITKLVKTAKREHLNIKKELKKRGLKPKYTVSYLSREMVQNIIFTLARIVHDK
ncbi:hypothetical protein [uncultured Gilliamella sp.]|uniref:hypothetical protein n=1 Tax=uncultured Gilliamella sp. TaxID=1193505 RepID=UPI0025CCD173|nr:hypothetical protein [uncultured Gilliamella sp.]